MWVPRRLFTSLALVLAVLFPACSSGGGESSVPEFPDVIPLGQGTVFPAILNSALGVGENRVTWHLLDEADNYLLDAEMQVRFYNLNADAPVLVGDTRARLVTSETSFIDETNDRERTVTGTAGVYVTHVTFDEAGDYGAELRIVRGAENETVLYRFNVLEDTFEPSIGDPAPASQQATTATAPLEEIDTSFPFRGGMHDLTIADAVASGRPTVIAFATPAYCTSRTCGPVLDLVLDPLALRYGEQAAFIHVEPYVLRDLRETNQRNLVPAMLEWRLQSEPWVFVVGPDGRVVAKYEGILAVDELESVLQVLLDGSEIAVTPAPSPQGSG